MLLPLTASKPHPQRGFSLLEVLISVVVLSVGLLGIAGLQVTGLRFAHAANLHYTASSQANDMADRMRANRVGVAAGAYNSISTISATNPGCISTGCTPAQIASVDVAEWGASLSTLLPSGTGSVTGTGAGSVFTITVSWSEMSANGVSVTQSYILNVRV